MQIKGLYIKDNEEKKIIVSFSVYDILKFLIYLFLVLYLSYLFMNT